MGRETGRQIDQQYQYYPSNEREGYFIDPSDNQQCCGLGDNPISELSAK